MFCSNTLEHMQDWRDRLAKLAASTGADLYATNTGWVDEGVNFGSQHVLRVRRGQPVRPAVVGHLGVEVRHPPAGPHLRPEEVLAELPR